MPLQIKKIDPIADVTGTKDPFLPIFNEYRDLGYRTSEQSQTTTVTPTSVAPTHWRTARLREPTFAAAILPPSMAPPDQREFYPLWHSSGRTRQSSMTTMQSTAPLRNPRIKSVLPPPNTIGGRTHRMQMSLRAG